MLPTRFFFTLVCLHFLAANVRSSTKCETSPPMKVNIDLWSTRSLLSPDHRWKFLSIGPHSQAKQAALYIQNTNNSKKWLIGSIERNGTAFWSGDSKRLFLRDEYAAADTRIRVVDVSGAVPEEINGLDDRIQKALFNHIPKGKTTQWLHYPEACFAANDSSTIIVVADAPLVPKEGSGSGVPFSVKLAVNVVTRHVIDAGPRSR